MGKVFINEDRMKMAIFKSYQSIKEMLDLRDEYMNFMNSKLVGNMNENEIKEFKDGLDKIMRKNFYNVDVYYSELSLLLLYLKKSILSQDIIPNYKDEL